MKNERNAGRKPKIDERTLDSIKDRIVNGESVLAIALEYGISRQALYNRLKAKREILSLDYKVEGNLVTRIDIDIDREQVEITNYTSRISEYAFGIINKPEWKDFCELIESEFIKNINATPTNGKNCFICSSKRKRTFSLSDVVGKPRSNLTINNAKDVKIPVFEFTKRDILYSRTDTDGYQFKALSNDRRLFVKSQAIISGRPVDDWRVEIIASNICEQLGIPCVMQNACDFVYAGYRYKGVYSKNFELDGYTFISFESLLERSGGSTRESEFIKLGSIEKLRWCADKLSILGSIDYDKTLKYMIDLALVDCIVGNVDRHTRNFGLFYDVNSMEYKIPLLFDNGMGLFEHDNYKDDYKTFDEAMMRVYVAPYGEDPFEMFRMLDREFHLKKMYPGLVDLNFDYPGLSPLAYEYFERIQMLWRR